MNTRWFEAFGLGIPILAALTFFGLFKAVFNYDPSTGLIAGISWNIIMGLALLWEGWAIWKKKI